MKDMEQAKLGHYEFPPRGPRLQIDIKSTFNVTRGYKISSDIETNIDTVDPQQNLIPN